MLFEKHLKIDMNIYKKSLQTAEIKLKIILIDDNQ